MAYPRKILTKIISSLARAATKKHGIKIMVIAGTYDTDLAKELIYSVLREKMNVRRNTSEIWWDLSVPLNILGYEDKKRNLFGWIGLILSAFVALIKNPKNPQLLILDADSNNQHTVNYWKDLLSPFYLIILNPTTNTELINELVLSTSANNGKIILPKRLETEYEVFSRLKKGEMLTFGKTNNSDIVLKISKTHLKVSYAKKTISLKRTLWLSYSPEITGSLFAVAVLEDIPLDEAVFSTLKFTIPSKFFSKIKNNLALKKANV